MWEKCPVEGITTTKYHLPKQAAISPTGHLLTAALTTLSMFLSACVAYMWEKQAVP